MLQVYQQAVTGKYAADGVRREIAGQIGKQRRSFVISCVAQPGAAKPVPVDEAGDGFMVVFHGVVSFFCSGGSRQALFPRDNRHVFNGNYP